MFSTVFTDWMTTPGSIHMQIGIRSVGRVPLMLNVQAKVIVVSAMSGGLAVQSNVRTTLGAQRGIFVLI